MNNVIQAVFNAGVNNNPSQCSVNHSRPLIVATPFIATVDRGVMQVE